MLWAWKEHEVTYSEESTVHFKESFSQIGTGGRSKYASVEYEVV